MVNLPAMKAAIYQSLSPTDDSTSFPKHLSNSTVDNSPHFPPPPHPHPECTRAVFSTDPKPSGHHRFSCFVGLPNAFVGLGNAVPLLNFDIE
mmetsp:Transcript_40328/g.47191  ORF Transcript_40328/g.47191 Transcript_40328/m.47191 type:complete len:92 (+) Transcript_40328:757-1032(+)